MRVSVINANDFIVILLDMTNISINCKKSGNKWYVTFKSIQLYVSEINANDFVVIMLLISPSNRLFTINKISITAGPV